MFPDDPNVPRCSLWSSATSISDGILFTFSPCFPHKCLINRQSKLSLFVIKLIWKREKIENNDGKFLFENLWWQIVAGKNWWKMLVLVFKALSFCLCLYLCLVTFEICEPNAFFKNIVFEALCPCLWLCESIHGVQSLGLEFLISLREHLQ